MLCYEELTVTTLSLSLRICWCKISNISYVWWLASLNDLGEKEKELYNDTYAISSTLGIFLMSLVELFAVPKKLI